jgi:hypothetical protein
VMHKAPPTDRTKCTKPPHTLSPLRSSRESVQCVQCAEPQPHLDNSGSFLPMPNRGVRAPRGIASARFFNQVPSIAVIQ